jgi:Na+:H+ antiporter, NhaA family
LGVLLAPLPLGVAAGLFLGKQIGIFASVRIAVALRLGARPANASWVQIYGIALLCGIGFTMSLFIGGLAFADPMLVDEVKIGVLGGSLMSAVVGYAVLFFAGSKKPGPHEANRVF